MRLVKGAIATKDQDSMTIAAELGLSFTIDPLDEFSVGDAVELAIDFTTNEIIQIRMMGAKTDGAASEPIIEPVEDVWLEEYYQPTSEED